MLLEEGSACDFKIADRREQMTYGEMRKPGRQNQIPEAVGVSRRGGIWTWKIRESVLVCTAR